MSHWSLQITWYSGTQAQIPHRGRWGLSLWGVRSLWGPYLTGGGSTSPCEVKRAKFTRDRWSWWWQLCGMNLRFWCCAIPARQGFYPQLAGAKYRGLLTGIARRKLLFSSNCYYLTWSFFFLVFEFRFFTQILWIIQCSRDKYVFK